MMTFYSIQPSYKSNDSVLEFYNSVLAINKLLDERCFVTCFDNSALHGICNKQLQIEKPTYDDLNHLVSLTLSGITSNFRFTGQLNSDMRKLATNLVVFPRLHFMTAAIAPICNKDMQLFKPINVHELTYEMFQPHSYMNQVDPRYGKYLALSAMYRGRIPTHEASQILNQYQKKNENYSTQCIPDNVKTSFCDVPPKGLKMSSTFLGNFTSIMEPFKQMSEKCQAQFKRKAFLHSYTSEGMEENEFKDAMDNIDKLVNELQ